MVYMYTVYFKLVCIQGAQLLRQFSFEWNSMLHYDVNTMGMLLFEPASEAHVEN